MNDFMFFEDDCFGGVEERCGERERGRRSRLICFCREVDEIREEERHHHDECKCRCHGHHHDHVRSEREEECDNFDW